MKSNKIVDGYEDGLFRPDNTITKSEFCKILINTLDINVNNTDNPYWAYDYIDACINSGIIEGKGGISSDIYDVEITREEAIASVIKAMKLVGLVDENKRKDLNIPDYFEIDEEYQKDILEAYSIGITNGVDETGRFDPFGTMTRAQICTILYRAITGTM